ncbi:hypothetical protein SUGI_0320460 [Cryptomeria japonica]|nr:hypothetical protein SUGI_0320460 [Cryptomeria japonica]
MSAEQTNLKFVLMGGCWDGAALAEATPLLQEVYDVTRFLEDHPGGDEVLLSSTGQDATDDFEDVGHSTSARAMMEEYYIGDIDLSSLPSKTKSGKTRKPAPSPQNSKSRVKFFQILVPLAILIFALAIGFYAKSS